MPYYDFRCTACELIVEDVMLSYDDRDLPCTEPCPACEKDSVIERIPSAPNIGDSVRLGRTHLPSAWTDKMQRMQKNYHRSTMRVPTPGKREI